MGKVPILREDTDNPKVGRATQNIGGAKPPLSVLGRNDVGASRTRSTGIFGSRLPQPPLEPLGNHKFYQSYLVFLQLVIVFIYNIST
jgi:hypothetical protein